MKRLLESYYGERNSDLDYGDDPMDYLRSRAGWAQERGSYPDWRWLKRSTLQVLAELIPRPWKPNTRRYTR